MDETEGQNNFPANFC